MSRDKDYPVTIEVKPRKVYRTLPMNSYYWGVVIAMIVDRLRELGHDIDRDLTHEFLKGRFLYSELTDPNTGEVMKIPRKTSELATEEFIEYMEHVKQFAAETLDIYIPDPNEQLQIG
jgi:capsule polysaccharide export protein KpsC/LpsZ